MITPTHPYWPMKNGSRIDYVAFIVKGVYHPDDMVMDINDRKFDDKQIPFSRTCIEVPKHRRPEIAVVGSNSGHVPTLADDWGDYVYYMGLWKPAFGPSFIGEVGDGHSETDPPDPELSMDPHPGERITVDLEGSSWSSVDGSVTRPKLKAVYATISQGKHWWPDQYPDTLRTALEERPGEEGNWIYNYLWARNLGPVDMWWGKRTSNPTPMDKREPGRVYLDTWEGWEWIATGHN